MKSKAEISSALALWDDTEAQMASLTTKQRSLLNEMTEENLFVSETNEIVDDSKSSKSGTREKSASKMSDSAKSGKTESKSVKLDTGRDFLDWLDKMETQIQTQKNTHFTVYHEKICD